MGTSRNSDLISVEDYLAGEEVSNVRQEYVSGIVYAMVGGTAAHSIISGNAYVALRQQLKDSNCRAYGADMKVRVQSEQGARFYYPDAQVVCDSADLTKVFQDAPVLIIEVLSDSTRRFDLNEKKDSYLTIPSLKNYVVLEQSVPAATVFCRAGDKFERFHHQGLDAVIDIEIGDQGQTIKLKLADVYQDISFDRE